MRVFFRIFIISLFLILSKGVLAAENLSSKLSSPVGMAFDSQGSLYISNWSAGTISRWSNGKIETYLTGIHSPTGIAFDSEDRLYIASYSSGEILRFNSKKEKEVYLDGLSVVAGINFDNSGNLLVCERGKSRIMKVSPSKAQSELVVGSPLRTPVGITQIDESIYAISDITGSVFLYDEKANNLALLTNKPTSPGIGIAYDSEKEILYSPDYGSRGVYVIDVNTGESEVLAMQLRSPVALAKSIAGEVYVGTWSDNSLYRLSPK
ncbi:hypothetical protein [uncultured Vibrio sp.]|uniref:Vgb family protein n=1 Tax=uncultured Vibrio sp. TaxID=114054 RepID=UPI002605C19D|nr:hypothetical protein [uncultured Vibrio sp.]